MKKKFSIKLTKPIVGKRFGAFQSIMKWAGIEKVDMRKYSPGDSASQINRRLSAKYQELYTNIFQQEKSLTLDIFLDINYNRRGWKYPNREQALTYSEDIVSYCQHQQIGIRFFRPKTNFRWTAKLEKKIMKKNNEELFTTLHDILRWVKKTKKIYQSLLQEFLNEATKEKPKRAIVIFSDFLVMDEEAKKMLHYLKKQHILFLFQLPIDPEQGQNYDTFFLQKNLPAGAGAPTKKRSEEIELLQID